MEGGEETLETSRWFACPVDSLFAGEDGTKNFQSRVSRAAQALCDMDLNARQKFSGDPILANRNGFLGGIIRGLVGFVKNKANEKANHFKPEYFLVTIAISGIVGAAAGILADTEWQVSFLAGYAGTDFIENLYKIKLSQKT